MKYLILILSLLASPALAIEVNTWSGAGPFACNGQCPQDWAEAQLTKEERQQLTKAQTIDPMPYNISIHDGDVFAMTTYFKNGEPVSYRDHTIAMLDEPENSIGWHMNGWSFVKLDACSNWTVVKHQNIYPGTTPMTARNPGSTVAGNFPSISTSIGIPETDWTYEPDFPIPDIIVITTPEPDGPTPEIITETPTPTPVPTLGTWIFMLSGLAMLIMWGCIHGGNRKY